MKKIRIAEDAFQILVTKAKLEGLSVTQTLYKLICGKETVTSSLKEGVSITKGLKKTLNKT